MTQFDEPDDPQGVASWDEALVRLEDLLLAHPYDRALPDLDTILEQADVTFDFVRNDERALKVLHEAIVARPLSTLDAIEAQRTRVEFLTLEVTVLTERLADPAADVTSVSARLDEIRRILREVLGSL